MSSKENGEYLSNNSKEKENSVIDIDLSSVESLLVSPKKLSEVLKELAPDEDLTIYVGENDTYFVKLKNRRGKEINQPLEIQRSDFLKCVSVEGIITLEGHKLVIESDTADKPPTIDEFLLGLNEEISEVVVHDLPKIEYRNMILSEFGLEKNLRINPVLLEQIHDHFNDVRDGFFDFYQTTGRKIFSNMDLFDSRTKINFCISDVASDNAAFIPVGDHEFLFRLCTKNNYLSIFDYYTIAHEIGHSGDILSYLASEYGYCDSFDKLYQKKLQRLGNKRNVVNEDWKNSRAWKGHDKFLAELFADSRSVLLYFWNYAKNITSTNSNFRDWENFKRNGHVSEKMVEEIRNLHTDILCLQRFFSNDQGNHLLVKILNFDPSVKKNMKAIEGSKKEQKSDFDDHEMSETRNQPLNQTSDNQDVIPIKVIDPEKLVSNSLEGSQKVLDCLNLIQKKDSDVYNQDYSISLDSYFGTSLLSLNFSSLQKWILDYQKYLTSENIVSVLQDKEWGSHIISQIQGLNSFIEEMAIEENGDTLCLMQNGEKIEDLNSWLQTFSCYLYYIMGSIDVVQVSLGEKSPEEAFQNNQRMCTGKSSFKLDEDVSFYRQYQQLINESMDLKREYGEKYGEIMSTKYHTLQYQKEKNILDHSLKDQLISQEEYNDQVYILTCFYQKIKEVTSTCGSNIELQEKQLAYWDANKSLFIMENKIYDRIIDNKKQFIDEFIACLSKNNAFDQDYMVKILQQGIKRQWIPEDTIALIKEYVSCSEKILSSNTKDTLPQLEDKKKQLIKKRSRIFSLMEEKFSGLGGEYTFDSMSALNSGDDHWKNENDILEIPYVINDEILKQECNMTEEMFKNMCTDRNKLYFESDCFNVFPFDACQKCSSNFGQVDWKTKFSYLGYDSFENMLNYMNYLVITNSQFQEWYGYHITENNINDFMQIILEKMAMIRKQIDNFHAGYSLDLSHFSYGDGCWEYHSVRSINVTKDMKHSVDRYTRHLSNLNAAIDEIDAQISVFSQHALYNDLSHSYVVKKHEIEKRLSSFDYFDCDGDIFMNLPRQRKNYY